MKSRGWRVVVNGGGGAPGGGAPSTVDFTLRPTEASMEFWADYLAAFPGLVEAGGALKTDDGQTFATFPTPLEADCSEEAYVRGDVDFSTGGGPVALEFLIGGDVAAQSFAVGVWNNAGPPFEPNSSVPTVAFSAYYENFGSIQGVSDLPEAADTYTFGDVIGVVVEGVTAHFFKNGVQQLATGDLTSPAVPLRVYCAQTTSL